MAADPSIDFPTEYINRRAADASSPPLVERFNSLLADSTAGKSEAFVPLGLCFEYGNGVKPNIYQAIKWYEQSASTNDAEGLFRLGACYHRGFGVRISKPRAQELLSRAMQMNHPIATAACLFHGYGCPQDKHKAFVQLLACDQKDPDVMLRVGWARESGHGTQKDQEEAVRLYKQAALQGHTIGIYNIGLAYNWARGVQKDGCMARLFMQTAADQGFPMAFFDLGRFHMFGFGTSIDVPKSLEYFRKAGEMGCLLAYHVLARYHAVSAQAGVVADAKKALHYSFLCVETHPDINRTIGSLYLLGVGVQRDVRTAIHHLILAGDQQSLRMAAKCYTKDDFVEAGEDIVKQLKAAAEIAPRI